MTRWTFYAQIAASAVILLFLALSVYKISQHTDFVRRTLEDEPSRSVAVYETILECYDTQARLLFAESIDRDEVKREVHAAWHAATDSARAVRRARLLSLTRDTFRNLTDARFRQLHFHFPDNSSFLRVHRPDRFGDSLTGVRSTVEAVNRDRTMVTGFEEGRIFNGYRNVFPLQYEGEHIGSVEVSYSFRAILERLKYRFGGFHQLVLLRDVVARKVFDSELSNYKAWKWDSRYLVDAGASDPSLFETDASEKDTRRLAQEFQSGLEQGGEFSRFVGYGGGHYLAMFHEVRNFLGEPIGYWISTEPNRAIVRSRNHLVLALAIHAFMVLLAAGVIVWLAALRRRLREYGSYLAICATCKKVRPAAEDPTDPENWITVEDYITDQSETRLTHGVCPACYRETLREAGIE